MRVTDLRNLAARLAPWVVSLVLAVVALGLGGRLAALRSENQAVQTERLLAEVAYKLGQAQLAERTLLAENMINHLGAQLRHAEDLARLKAFALAAPGGPAREAAGIAVWDAAQTAGRLQAENLPALAETQDFQIWILDSTHPDPVSGGVFHPTHAGPATFAFKPDQPVGPVHGFALSLESKGGGLKAEGPLVLRSK